jgi:ABC-2 type transport system ATP-binding protein
MHALSVQHLNKTYKNEVVALRDVSLDVEEGDFFALLGPNGAGKSTLIGIVTSLVNKTSGTVRVFDADADNDIERAKAYIGLVPQEVNFNQFEKPFDIVVNQAGYYGIPRRLARERAEKYLKTLSLWDKRDGPSRELSGGMKRRLMIARAMVHEPRLLILDEPTAGVDIEVRRSMWRYLEQINAEGTTVILTTHYLEEAENLCRNVAIIDHGRIIENTGVKELLGKLHVETFVLDTRDPVRRLPELDGYKLHQRDATTLEAEVPKTRSLNNLFQALEDEDIKVLSMRNKANRLEELFVRMVQDNDDAA